MIDLLRHDSPGIFVVQTDRQGRIVASNPSWSARFGDRPRLSSIVDRPQWGHWPAGPATITARDDEHRAHALSGTLHPIDDGFLLVASIDPGIADRTQKLLLLSSELDDLHRIADAQRKRIEQERGDLQALMAGIIHDMQSPMLALDVVARRSNAPPEIAQGIGKALDVLRRLRSQLLSYAQAGRVGVRLSDVDLAGLVDEAAAQAGAEVAFTLRHDGLPMVQGDHDLLLQLFNNLINNSIKFQAERPLEISIHAEGDAIHVDDNGVGIEPGHAESMFTPFQRHSARPGTGLGLALARRIMELHGGSIEATPLSPGCRVTLRFPHGTEPTPAR